MKTFTQTKTVDKSSLAVVAFAGAVFVFYVSTDLVAKLLTTRSFSSPVTLDSANPNYVSASKRLRTVAEVQPKNLELNLPKLDLSKMNLVPAKAAAVAQNHPSNDLKVLEKIKENDPIRQTLEDLKQSYGDSTLSQNLLKLNQMARLRDAGRGFDGNDWNRSLGDLKSNADSAREEILETIDRLGTGPEHEFDRLVIANIVHELPLSTAQKNEVLSKVNLVILPNQTGEAAQN